MLLMTVNGLPIKILGPPRSALIGPKQEIAPEATRFGLLVIDRSDGCYIMSTENLLALQFKSV